MRLRDMAADGGDAECGGNRDGHRPLQLHPHVEDDRLAGGRQRVGQQRPEDDASVVGAQARVAVDLAVKDGSVHLCEVYGRP